MGKSFTHDDKNTYAAKRLIHHPSMKEITTPLLISAESNPKKDEYAI